MTATYVPFDAALLPPAMDLNNPSHFEQFVVSYSHVVLAVCQRLLKDTCAAEDASQETFAAAWRHRAKLQPNRAWLLRVATNKCLDELRRRSRHLEHTGEDDAMWQAQAPDPTPEVAALSAETHEVLQRVLRDLPWAQRVAIVLLELEGWTYAEIAQSCDVSVGTVKSRIFRARRTLRQALGESGVLDQAC